MILIAGNGQLPLAIKRRLQTLGTDAKQIRTDDDDVEPLTAEEIRDARVLILAADDDSCNVDLALQARQACPQLPLIVRVFDTTLAAYLSETISGITILSMSKVSAPLFAEAARRILQQPVAERSGKIKMSCSSQRYRPDRILVGALLSLFLLVFPSALFFSHALNIRYMDALYFVWTTVMTVGYGDISLKDAGDGAKLFGMALMLSGASFIAILFALLSGWVLNRRLEILNGRVRMHNRHHVVIAGAGNVGFRIAEMLATEGKRLVVIERDAENKHIPALRAAGHHVIIADATNRDTLELAGIDSAALVMAVTDIDAVNLQIALHVREMQVPVILRLNSAELSVHVTERGDGIAISPILAAAEAFAQAAI